MRTLVVHMQTSLDGRIARADGTFWEPFAWGEVEQGFINEAFRRADTWVMGRHVFEAVVPWWEALARGRVAGSRVRAVRGRPRVRRDPGGAGEGRDLADAGRGAGQDRHPGRRPGGAARAQVATRAGHHPVGRPGAARAHRPRTGPRRRVPDRRPPRGGGGGATAVRRGRGADRAAAGAQLDVPRRRRGPALRRGTAPARRSRRSRRAAPAASSASPRTRAGGCTSGAARTAGTSGAATRRPAGTRGSTRSTPATRSPGASSPATTGPGTTRSRTTRRSPTSRRPESRPVDQARPGPADRVPPDWEDHLHG